MVLAGGFLRDSILGRTPNDLDFFITLHGYEYPYIVEEVLPNLVNKLNFKPIQHKKNYDSATFESHTGEFPLQIICSTKSRSGILKDFDFSINQIWYSLEEGLMASKAFMTTLKTGEIKVTSKRYTSKRYERFSKEFEGFSLPTIPNLSPKKQEPEPIAPQYDTKKYKKSFSQAIYVVDPSV